MENPFSLKVGKVFTGFGVGCGIGIGVGRPIPFGSIPALHQVLSATRGATDVFFGATKYVNGFLKNYGMKNIEAGLGCGVGVGHGYGVGIALKPGVVRQLQSSVEQAIAKIMTNLGVAPSLSSLQSVIPGLVPSGIGMLSRTPAEKMQTLTNSGLGSASKIKVSTFQNSTRESKEIPSDISVGTCSEKVVNTFLQNPLLRSEEEMELSELAENLRSENNMIQVLLKHQQAINELIEENQKLRQILEEDLKISPNKLGASNLSSNKSSNPCSNCFDCRRRKRKSSR